MKGQYIIREQKDTNDRDFFQLDGPNGHAYIINQYNKREGNMIFAEEEKSSVGILLWKSLQAIPGKDVSLAYEVMNSLTCLL